MSDDFERSLTNELLDILSDDEQPEITLLAALRLLLKAADRSGAALFINVPGNARRAWHVEVGLSAAWTGQLAQAHSPVRQLAEAVTRPATANPEPPPAGLAAALPILAREQRVGALLIEGPPLADTDRERLTHLGHCLGRAVQHYFSDRDSRQRGREAAALEKIAAAMTSSLQLDEILTSTIEGIGEVLDVQAVSLLLRDEHNGSLLFKKCLDGGPDWIVQQSQDIPAGLMGACLGSGEMILVEDAAADPRFVASVDELAEVRARALLLAPLLTRGACTGVIAVINKRRGRFGSRDRGLLGTLAASVAGAVYNARLYHEAITANNALETNRAEILGSRNTLRSLFDSIPSPLYIVDRDCRLVAVNRACARRAGREPQAIVGMGCLAGLNRTEAACHSCLVRSTFETGVGAQRHEQQPGEPGQRPSEWEISTYPIQNGAEPVSQVIVFEQDVTDQRRLEASLAQSEKLAAMGQLSAGIVHEIGNPLTAVRLNADLLQRSLPEGSEEMESADLITLAVDRAIGIVRELLDFSRQADDTRAPVDINATVRQAARLAEHQLHSHSIDLVYELAEALPLVAGSRDHLQGVWLNLIMNARDAMRGPRREIRLRTQAADRGVEVSITDTGEGIPPEHLARIFEPFFSTKAVGQGTGLGLSVCQRVVTQHGGEIRVESTVGQGTSFIVRLPAI